MNIEDFKPLDLTWEQIWEKQREIKFLYEPEAKQIFEDFDIDCYEDQEIFRRYCWRIVEELCEANEAKFALQTNHYIEEMIDALNFAIELNLLYGLGPEIYMGPGGDIIPSKGTADRAVFVTGMAANCLKSRQWRRSQYLVDLTVFEPRLKQIFLSIIGALRLKMSDEEIRKAWSLKYQVNLFRIKSNY